MYKKSKEAKRTDPLAEGQILANGERLLINRNDVTKICVRHNHPRLGPAKWRYDKCHTLAKDGYADLNDPPSVELTLTKMERKGFTEDDIRHLVADIALMQYKIDVYNRNKLIESIKMSSESFNKILDKQKKEVA